MRQSLTGCLMCEPHSPPSGLPHPAVPATAWAPSSQCHPYESQHSLVSRSIIKGGRNPNATAFMYNPYIVLIHTCTRLVHRTYPECMPHKLPGCQTKDPASSPWHKTLQSKFPDVFDSAAQASRQRRSQSSCQYAACLRQAQRVKVFLSFSIHVYVYIYIYINLDI